MHIILSRWKPEYLLGLATAIQMASRARREAVLERVAVDSKIN